MHFHRLSSNVPRALYPRTFCRRLRRTVPSEGVGTAVSLLLAVIVAGLALRAIAGSAPDAAPATVAASQPRRGPTSLDRFDAVWEDARSRLGGSIGPSRALPTGVRPFVATWQPPDRMGLHAGMLRAWYIDATDGVVFELNIGVGVGVSARCAPPDMHGSTTLATGTSVTWVRGHQSRDENFVYHSEWHPDECMLTEQWLWLGVAPSGGVGWRLMSYRLPLEDLVRVASSFP
jgi:hypothetical protein